MPRAALKDSGYGIQCPKCAGPHTDVTDSRPARGYIRRRRLCKDCLHKFTTHEIIMKDGAILYKALGMVKALERMNPASTRLVDDLVGILAKEPT